MRKIAGEKILVFMLIFSIVVSGLFCGQTKEVYAAETTLLENMEIDGVVYKEIEPGKVELIEYKKKIEYHETVQIPETVTYLDREYTVVSIGDSVFYNQQFMGGIDFPDTLESIGTEAFNYCMGIESLTLPANLKKIGSRAFWDCTSISGELVIPESVTWIGGSAFRNIRITSLVILSPDCDYDTGGTFCDDTELVSVKLPEGMRSLAENFFLRCPSLEEINLPDGIPSIPRQAFKGCSSLKEIHIPDSVNSIGNAAFNGCSSLKEVVVPEGVTEIPTQAFLNCSEELCVTFPDSVTSVHNWTFWENSQGREKYSTTITVKCTSREVAALVAGIGHQNILLNGEPYELVKFDTDTYKFTVTDGENNYVQLDKYNGTKPSGEVSIPGTVEWNGKVYTVKTIGSNAFSSCSEITKITLPDTITGIGKSAFMSCDALEFINLPEGITRIEQWTFSCCSALKDLVLPSNLQYIGLYAFEDCASLQTIEIPESCTLIEMAAFKGCSGLTEVKLPEGITEIPGNMFCGCTGIKEISLPDSVQKIGSYAFQNCTGLEEITLNQGVTEIGTEIFKGCEKLTGIIILPDSVETIRTEAFVNSSLSGVHVGSGLTLLESEAFPDAIRLTTNSPEVWKLLVEKTDRENAPVFLWDGTCDVPAGMHGYVEEDTVVSDSVTIEEGAIVTIMSSASLTVEDTLINNGMIEGEGVLTVNGTITGTGSLGEGMQMTFLLKEDMVAAVGDAVYRAAPIAPEPEVSISLSGEKVIFEKDTDFTYSYANNTNPGTADITVTPKTGGRIKGESVTKQFIIKKAVQTAPAECSLTFSENEDGKTFSAEIARVQGAEYSFDGEIWSDDNTKTDCQPNTEYTAYIRMKETDTHFASEAVQKTLKTPEIPEATPTATPTATPEAIPTASPTATPEAIPTATPAATPEVTPVATPEATPDATPEIMPTVTPEATPEATPTASPEASPTATPEVIPTASPEASPTATPEVIPTASPEASPTATPEVIPTATPEATPTASPEASPTATPEASPETTPVVTPEVTPSATPESTPTTNPEVTPTVLPDVELPAPEISQLKAIAGKKGVYVRVTVKAVAGADRYEIYRTYGKKTKLIKTTASGKVKIWDKKPVKNAKYYAVAISKDGSVRSAAGTAKAIKLSKRTKIKKVLSASGGIKILWKKVKNAKKYVVYRSTKKNSGYVKVKSLGKKKLSYNDKKGKKKKKYYYKVAVVTKSKCSLMSAASKRVKYK